MTWLNWPNRITVGRIVLVAPLVICLLNLNAGSEVWRYLALVLLITLAVSDALDGFLARRLGEETAVGRFLDPVADKLLITCAVVLLAIGESAVPGYQLPRWVPVVAIGKDLLTIIGFGLIYATTGEYFIQPRVWGKSCTLVQLVTVTYCLVAPEMEQILPFVHRAWVALYWLASGLAVVALTDYVRIGCRFAAMHPARSAEG
jgi:CDP-diacylglycerol--glycerol-3-phosphate 3-phosphatidyltransferase